VLLATIVRRILSLTLFFNFLLDNQIIVAVNPAVACIWSVYEFNGTVIRHHLALRCELQTIFIQYIALQIHFELKGFSNLLTPVSDPLKLLRILLLNSSLILSFIL